MWEYAYQCEPIEGGKMESPLYVGVRWSKVEGQRVQCVKGSSVPNPPADGSYWSPQDCQTHEDYPYGGGANQQWRIPDELFEPLYRQAFWLPDVPAGGPSDQLPGIWYEAVYGAHVYGKGNDPIEHPQGRDHETSEIESRGILVATVPDPKSAGNMRWYLARVFLSFYFPFYCRDESDPAPGGEPRWAGFWPVEVVNWFTESFLQLVFVCIHTTYEGNRRIFGKYADEYEGKPVPHMGIISVEWGLYSEFLWQQCSNPFPTPAGHQDFNVNDENGDEANLVLPYRGPCSWRSRGLWWVDRDYYDTQFANGVYYPCGIHLL